MIPFERLHRLAAPRGDGLHPELAALLHRRAAIAADPTVIEIGYSGQSGPNPAAPEVPEAHGNVVPFPKTPKTACEKNASINNASIR